MILHYQIVPNDKRIYVTNLLKEIWTVSKEKVCEVVYTDNPKVDDSAIQNAYRECFPSMLKVDVLLDIFHGKSRVTKEMNKSHPDYKEAKKDLTAVFSNLQKFGNYATEKELSEAFNEWMNKYSVVHSNTALNFSEQMEYIYAKQKK